jgi:2-amino-4-hydroxy-6-hydroxymethyldihydropteridine diphosphokinase
LAIAYLGLGSNLGERHLNLIYGLQLLSSSMELVRLSSVYETEPWGYTEQSRFLNLVCKVQTDTLSAYKILENAIDIERKVGRKPSFTYGPRILDIDLLLYGDEVISTNKLVVPHPRMGERAFVLVPLAEIASSQVHPLLGLSIKDLLKQVPGVKSVKLWAHPFSRDAL